MAKVSLSLIPNVTGTETEQPTQSKPKPPAMETPAQEAPAEQPPAEEAPKRIEAEARAAALQRLERQSKIE
jgi:hypothetical protein